MLARLGRAAYGNAYLLLTLTTLFWAGNFTLGRGVHGTVPPIALAWSRWTLASLLILPFAWRHLKRDWPLLRQHAGIVLFLGATGVGAFNSLAYLGLNYTTALNGLILQSSAPVMIALAAFFFFGDRVSPRQGVGIVLSLIGVLIIVTQGDLSRLSQMAFNQGDLLIFGAMAIWAIYTVFVRKRPSVHPVSFAAATFIIGAIVNTPIFLFEHASGWRLQPTPETFAAIAYVSIFPSILSYIFFNRGVELIGSNRAGVFLHLVPFFGAVLAITLLGERLQLFHLAGFALILTGVTLASRKA